MQTIIVATDLSPEADNATLYAINAAKITGSKIVLFHLYKVSSHVAHSLANTHEIDKMVWRMQQQMATYANIINREHKVLIEIVVRMGDFLEVVEQVAAQYESTLLVLGMPQKTFEQDLLGNTTTSAIYKLKIPILAVPEAASFKGIHKILYACDINRGVYATVLNTIKEYAGHYNAEVQVLYVGDVVKSLEHEEQLKKGLEGIHYYYKNVRSESVVKAIQDEAELIQADLLIMMPQKYGFWSSILHRSKTRAMASNGKIPLLSLNY